MFITFHGSMEDSVKDFYEDLIEDERSGEIRGLFQDLAKENGKHKEMVLRTYREVITDAFEGGFPLVGLDEKNYKLETEVIAGMNLPTMLDRALELEEACKRFCEDAAASTKGLMADVPQAFEWVAKRKARRIEKIKSWI
jgi:rubrerythrin